MNKKELKKHIEGLPYSAGLIVDTIKINRNGLLKLIEQLDEPQKPIVPQFVADWYEENKDDFETNLFNTIGLVIRDFEDGDLSAFEEWILDKHKAPFQTLVNMHQFGYEVEKEKRYFVKMKGMQKDCVALKKNKDGGYWYLSDTYPYGSTVNFHTRKELEQAGFGWVFDCPGIEIEEVQDDSKI